MAREKNSQVKYKALQYAKEKGALVLPYLKLYLKLYFAACCLVWMKEWVLLRNRRLLDLEDHDLRFG